MRIYFLRHGVAEDAGPGMSDEERRLTPAGRAEVKRVAEALRQLDLGLERILTSPLPRASETAEIVADALELRKELQVDQRLAYGFRLGALQEMAAEWQPAKRVMLVGHNPGMAVVPGQLAGGAALDMKKAGFIRVDAEVIEPGAGLLKWLVPPALLTRG